MKIKIEYDNLDWDTFEKKYNEPDAENMLACTFEYMFQYKEELIKKFSQETSEIKKELILAKIDHIRKILECFKDLSTYLNCEATAL